MNFDKYIFDWENKLLEENEYFETNKYAFSLLKKAQFILNEHINTFNMETKEKNNMILINDLLTKIYLETSHVELEFNNKYSN